MYLEHYGLNEAPFRITPHTGFFYAGADRGATLEALIHAVVHGDGIVKVIGEVGSGKTLLSRMLIERLPDGIAAVYLANPSLSREDVFYALASELGVAIPDGARASSAMRAVQETLVGLHDCGKQPVVLIDEAHAMPVETLDEMRRLCDLEANQRRLLKLVLFGQPELEAVLLRADMRQLRERITHSFTLAPLAGEALAQYLDFRLRAAGHRGPSPFTPAAIELIGAASQGLARRINILADKALLAAFAAGKQQVDAKEARTAIRDADFAGLHAVRRRALPPVGALWAAGGSAAMLAIVFAWRVIQEPAPPTPTQVGVAATPQPAAPAPATAISPPSSPAQPQAPPPPQVPPIKPPAGLEQAPTLARKIEEGRAWIETAPDERWFIQLFTTPDDAHPERTERFLVRLADLGVDMSKVRAYHSDLAGTRRYGVIYGDFVSQSEASVALEDLPAELKRHRPYLRQAVRLKPPPRQPRPPAGQ